MYLRHRPATGVRRQGARVHQAQVGPRSQRALPPLWKQLISHPANEATVASRNPNTRARDRPHPASIETYCSTGRSACIWPRSWVVDSAEVSHSGPRPRRRRPPNARLAPGLPPLQARARPYRVPDRPHHTLPPVSRGCEPPVQSATGASIRMQHDHGPEQRFVDPPPFPVWTPSRPAGDCAGQGGRGKHPPRGA